MKYWLIYLITFITGIMGLTSCNDNSSAAQSSSAQNLVVEVVASSRPSFGFSVGQIQMAYRFLDLPVIGIESRLKLRFELPPLQNLHLTFSDNHHIELLQNSISAYEGTKNGIVDVIIKFKALQAGKTYLKFIASTADGEKMRAFAIALPVADLSGTVPEKKKATRSRINLPSSR